MLIALLIITGVLRYLFALPKQSGIDKPDGKAEPCVAQTWYQEWKHVKHKDQNVIKKKNVEGLCLKSQTQRKLLKCLQLPETTILPFYQVMIMESFCWHFQPPTSAASPVTFVSWWHPSAANNTNDKTAFYRTVFRTMLVLIRITGVSSWIRRSSWR